MLKLVCKLLFRIQFVCNVWKKHIRKKHSGDTKDTENIVKQEFIEEPDIGIDEEDIDNKNFAGIGDIKPEPIDSSIYVE